MRAPEFVHTHGVMGSGKTLAAIQREMTLSRRNYLYVITKSSVDTRAGQQIRTRFGDVSRDVDFVTHPDDSFAERTIRALKAKDQHGRIGNTVLNMAAIIDEVNFMSEEQVTEARQLVDDFGINVYTFGIETDFLDRPFIGEQTARKLADRSIKLEADCYGIWDDGDCHDVAAHNARLVDDAYVFVGDQVAINEEGEEIEKRERVTTYRSLCDACYTLAKLESQQR